MKRLQRQIFIPAIVLVALLGFAFFMRPSIERHTPDFIAEHQISVDSLVAERHFDTLRLDSVAHLISKLNAVEKKCLNERLGNDSIRISNAPGFPTAFFKRDFLLSHSPLAYNKLKGSPVRGFEKENSIGISAPILREGNVDYVVLPFDILAAMVGGL